jgi:hypothetical protein
MLRKHIAHLLAPNNVDGGGQPAPQAMPDTIGSWMKGLDEPALSDAPPADPPDDTKGKEPKDDASKTNPDVRVDAALGDGKTPPAKPADKPAVKPEEDKLPRTAQEWAKFKQARKEREEALTKEKEELAGKIKELQASFASTATITPEQQKELERLKGEVEEYSKRLQIVDVQSHPKFQAYFQKKTDEQLALAKSIVGADRAEEVSKLLMMPEGEYKTVKIEQLLADLSTLQQSRLGSVLNALDVVNREKETEITHAKENYQKMQEEQKAAGLQRRQAAEKLFGDTVAAMQDAKAGMAAFQKREGDEKWNAGVDERITRAKELIWGKDVSPDRVMKAALHAAAMPAILESHQRLHDENQKLQAQVAELQAAKPGLEGGTPPKNSEGMQRMEVRRGMSPQEVTAAWAKSLPD